MISEFISGGTAVASFVIAAFFIRYWQQTRDRLFLMFAAGFLTFGISRVVLAFLGEDDEGRVLIYALRLVAFALILIAIVQKNRTPPAPGQGGSGNGYHGTTRSGTVAAPRVRP